MPAAPWLPFRFSSALVTISFAGPGATCSTFLISSSIMPWPKSPSSDTSAISAGNTASTP